jgi:phage gp36-like protein
VSYCAKSDLVQRYGTDELSQLTDETAAQSTDDLEITNACDEASSLIDSYLSARYAVPLASVPTMVRKWACAIARKFLWKDRAGADSEVTAAYEDALKQLRDVARGLSGLPDVTGVLPATIGGIRYTLPDRVFDTTGLL